MQCRRPSKMYNEQLLMLETRRQHKRESYYSFDYRCDYHYVVKIVATNYKLQVWITGRKILVPTFFQVEVSLNGNSQQTTGCDLKKEQVCSSQQ